jgi:hypothetical protein
MIGKQLLAARTKGATDASRSVSKPGRNSNKTTAFLAFSTYSVEQLFEFTSSLYFLMWGSLCDGR